MCKRHCVSAQPSTVFIISKHCWRINVRSTVEKAPLLWCFMYTTTSQKPRIAMNHWISWLARCTFSSTLTSNRNTVEPEITVHLLSERLRRRSHKYQQQKTWDIHNMSDLEKCSLRMAFSRLHYEDTFLQRIFENNLRSHRNSVTRQALPRKRWRGACKLTDMTGNWYHGDTCHYFERSSPTAQPTARA